MAVIRISAKTNMLITTRSILFRLHQYRYAEVQALGRFSVRRAETAIVRAATILEMENLKLLYRYRRVGPGTDGNEKEGIRFFLSAVQELPPPTGPQESPDEAFAVVPTGPFEKKSLSGFTLPAGSSGGTGRLSPRWESPAR
jgi:stage V sporulation protein SpoVS